MERQPKALTGHMPRCAAPHGLAVELWADKFLTTANNASVTNARPESSARHAGRFGFQKEMNALKSLKMPNAEENHNVQALLNSTQEIEDRYKIFWRWWRVWRADVRAGWVVLGRFKVTQAPLIMPHSNELPSCVEHEPWEQSM